MATDVLTYEAFLRQAFSRSLHVAVVKVATVAGSTPRDCDAVMLVSQMGTHGTIGGGRLEWMAIAEARAMLMDSRSAATVSIALGPQTGQCCGGKVTLDITHVRDEIQAKETDARLASGQNQHRVYVFGAGHVGGALAQALSLLPLQTILVDTRADVLKSIALRGVETLHTNHPEEVVNNATSNSAFVILTHDHALDSRIASAVLERGDFRYLGIIGSKTKRQRFIHAFRQTDIPEDKIARLVCPIGGTALRDKRPAVIAALVAAELAVALFQP